MVGGRDFKDSPFNRATQAPRQPGSGFKPFVYTAAIDAGFSPADTIMDAPILIPGAGAAVDAGGATDPDRSSRSRRTGCPRTTRASSRERAGCATRSRSRSTSRRSSSACIVGPEAVARYARDMGITSRLANVYSLALGSAEVTLFDMVKAYGVLANQGIAAGALRRRADRGPQRPCPRRSHSTVQLRGGVARRRRTS